MMYKCITAQYFPNTLQNYTKKTTQPNLRLRLSDNHFKIATFFLEMIILVNESNRTGDAGASPADKML